MRSLRGLRRRLRSLVAGAMLTFAVFFAFLWCWDFTSDAWVSREVFTSDPYRVGFTDARVQGGRLLLRYSRHDNLANPQPTFAKWTSGVGWSAALYFDAPASLCAVGIDWQWKTRTLGVSRHTERVLSVPFWMLIIVTAGIGLPLARHNRRERRRRAGLCPGCGYDLRATPECCPECGLTPAAAT